MSSVALLLAVLPSFVLGKYVDTHDRMGKEPRSLLVKCFLGGLVSIIITLVINDLASLVVDTDSTFVELPMLAIHCLLDVSLVEEFSKWIVLKKITWNNKEFDHIYDAIVYSVFVSLGFATIENILYIIGSDFSLSLAIMRAILSVPGHVFFAVFMGYNYGIAKQAYINGNKNIYKSRMFYSLFIPTLLHGIFDFCLLSKSGIILLVYLIFIIFLYIKAFSTVNRISKVNRNMKD